MTFVGLVFYNAVGATAISSVSGFIGEFWMAAAIGMSVYRELYRVTIFR
jgi:hypothetical protein